MAHLLEEDAQGARMVYAGATPWHGLGIKLPERVTWQEGLKLSRNDWTVELRPMHTRVDIPGVGLTEYPIEDFRALCRSDDGVLGVVTPAFKPVQNAELFGLFDAAFGGGIANLETCGAIKGGREVWALARIPEAWKIAGELHSRYLLLLARHGTGACVGRLVLERVVCNNTLQVALSETSDTEVRVLHRGDTEKQIEACRGILAAALVQAEEMRTFQEELALLNLDPPDRVATVKTIVLGDDEDVAAERASGPRYRAMIDDINRRILQGRTIPDQHRTTAYGLLQGVTDYVDHFRMTEAEMEKRVLYATTGAGEELKQRTITVLRRKLAA